MELPSRRHQHCSGIRNAKVGNNMNEAGGLGFLLPFMKVPPTAFLLIRNLLDVCCSVGSECDAMVVCGRPAAGYLQFRGISNPISQFVSLKTARHAKCSTSSNLPRSIAFGLLPGYGIVDDVPGTANVRFACMIALH